MVTHLKDGHPAYKGWSSAFPGMFTHHPKFGHPSSHGLSLTSKGWSHMVPSMVIHHPKLRKSDTALKKFQPNMDFNTCVAQLVSVKNLDT